MEAEIAKLTLPPKSERDHIEGPPSAPVTRRTYSQTNQTRNTLANTTGANTTTNKS
jgi:hypothetical protein